MKSLLFLIATCFIITGSVPRLFSILCRRSIMLVCAFHPIYRLFQSPLFVSTAHHRAVRKKCESAGRFHAVACGMESVGRSSHSAHCPCFVSVACPVPSRSLTLHSLCLLFRSLLCLSLSSTRARGVAMCTPTNICGG